MSNYTWIPFHTELADVMLTYRNSRTDMIRKVILTYQKAGIKMPKLDSADVPVDMDPFTVFGIFCKGMKESNRIALCKAIKEVFAVKAAAPSDFNGIPVLNPLNATFYRFADDPDRGANDIDGLWACFAATIDYADHPSKSTKAAFVQAYDRVKDLKGNRWKLTMGLYWVRPYAYLSLDSRNRWFLTTVGKIDDSFAATINGMKDIPGGAAYVDVCMDCNNIIHAGKKYGNIVELSYDAWIISEKVNQEQKQKEQYPAKETEGAALADQDVRPVHYWLYAPGENAGKWDAFYDAGVMGLGWSELGDISRFTSRDEITAKLKEVRGDSTSYKNSALANWQFVHDMVPGDIVFVKKGRDTIIGRGVVASDYFYDEEQGQDGYSSLRNMKWTHKGTWSHAAMGKMPLKTLTDITQYTEYVEQLMALVTANDDESNLQNTDEEAPMVTYPVYSAEDFLSEVYMSSDDYTTLVGLLRKKKNVILQGAPGVGKTFTAKHLAYSMMGVKDQDRVAMVQFHQSYSYEDFIMGFRPNATGFELKKGVFYTFCKKAQDDPDNEYFFIIDEINRGNLSKIFGELFMLIENDKRGISMQLLYADEKFSVPANVMIIGMMNTADRSLAMMDYALRRRFAFFEMVPGFDTDGFRKYQESLSNERFNKLISCVTSMNKVIAEDESLGDGFRIGHSYFSNLDADGLNDADLKNIVRFELIPLLKEYWFDEPQKVKDWTAKLESAVK